MTVKVKYHKGIDHLFWIFKWIKVSQKVKNKIHFKQRAKTFLEIMNNQAILFRHLKMNLSLQNNPQNMIQLVSKVLLKKLICPKLKQKIFQLRILLKQWQKTNLKFMNQSKWIKVGGFLSKINSLTKVSISISFKMYQVHKEIL